MLRFLKNFVKKKASTQNPRKERTSSAGESVSTRKKYKKWVFFALLLLTFLLVTWSLFKKSPPKGQNRISQIEEACREIFHQPLKKILFQTDGTLTLQWAGSQLHLPKDIDIMAVDIGELKGRLEETSQVKSAFIERRFPDTLFVKIAERKPLLRVLVQEKRKKKELLVDEEGIVFSGEHVPVIDRQQLPFLDGTALKKKGNHYQRIEGIYRVCSLLTLAKTKYRQLYAQMEVVSIEHSCKKAYPWSRIKVRCQFASQVVFKDGDFDEQLKRLDFILSTPRVKQRLPVAKIDLSYTKDGVVQFRR